MRRSGRACLESLLPRISNPREGARVRRFSELGHGSANRTPRGLVCPGYYFDSRIIAL